MPINSVIWLKYTNVLKYITKVMKEHGNFVGNTITDENEWNQVKGLIRQIAKDSKNNIPISVNDLEDSDLEGLNVNGRRPFKLMNTVVEGLASNRGTKKEIGAADEMFPIDFMESEPKVQRPKVAPAPRVDEIDYKSLAMHLQEELKAMEQELDAYKEKLNRIYNVLTEESR